MTPARDATVYNLSQGISPGKEDDARPAKSDVIIFAPPVTKGALLFFILLRGITYYRIMTAFKWETLRFFYGSASVILQCTCEFWRKCERDQKDMLGGKFSWVCRIIFSIVAVIFFVFRKKKRAVNYDFLFIIFLGVENSNFARSSAATSRSIDEPVCN